MDSVRLDSELLPVPLSDIWMDDHGRARLD
jgi:hypothetical protein